MTVGQFRAHLHLLSLECRKTFSQTRAIRDCRPIRDSICLLSCMVLNHIIVFTYHHPHKNFVVHYSGPLAIYRTNSPNNKTTMRPTLLKCAGLLMLLAVGELEPPACCRNSSQIAAPSGCYGELMANENDMNMTHMTYFCRGICGASIQQSQDADDD